MKKHFQSYGNPNKYIKAIFLVVGLAFFVYGLATIGSKKNDEIHLLLSLAEIIYGLFMGFYAFYIFPLPAVFINEQQIVYRTSPFFINFKTTWDNIQEVILGKNFLKITLNSNEPHFFYIHSKYEEIQEGLRNQLKELQQSYHFELVEQDIEDKKT